MEEPSRFPYHLHQNSAMEDFVENQRVVSGIACADVFTCGSRTAGGVLSCRDKKVPKETLSLRRETFPRFSAETGVGRQHIPVLRPTRASRARPYWALSVSVSDARRAGRGDVKTKHPHPNVKIPMI